MTESGILWKTCAARTKLRHVFSVPRYSETCRILQQCL
jgi:hypothetical protein